MSDAVFASNIDYLPMINQGKVRDIYQAGDEYLLIVTTDRLSAFDVILSQPINGKGRILNQLALFWFEKSRHIIANHLADAPLADYLRADDIKRLDGRAMLVKKMRPLPIEAVVRGYLAGSGYLEYQKTGSICGVPLPANLQQAQKLPEVIFTPATKAEQGAHDENISFAKMAACVGADVAAQVQKTAIAIYEMAAAYALERGIIIADTKFEFGLDANDNLVLIDEVLTPDSSRFWPQASYQVGISPPSFDKQFVRDYLLTLPWDKTAPAPELPAEILAKTAAKYQEAAHILIGSH